MRARIHTLYLAIVLGFTAPALAQESYRHDRTMPAVSEFYGLGGIRGDATEKTLRDTRRGVALGEIYLPAPRPIPSSIGLGIGAELGVGHADEQEWGEAFGLHGALFWRDPTLAFAGIAATYDRSLSIDRANLSGFGGVYLGSIDLTGVAGYEGGNGTERALFRAEAAWYANEHLRFGAEFSGGTGDFLRGVGRIHSQIYDRLVLSLAVGGGEVENDRSYSISVGFTVHFARSKSLETQIRRDRLILFD